MQMQERYENQKRKSLSYQTYLRLLESMRKGHYFDALAEIQKGRMNGSCASFKYRKSISYALEGLVQLQADYEKFGDEIFEKFKVKREREFKIVDKVNAGGFTYQSTHFVRGIEDEADMQWKTGVWSDLNDLVRWRTIVFSGKKWNPWEEMKNGTKDKPAWLERNLAEKPPYSGHRGGVSGTEGSLPAKVVRKRAGNRAKADSNAKGTDKDA